jgi:hypothetical protein
VREPPFARLDATREARRANHIAPPDEAGAPASASAADEVDEVSPPDEVDEVDEVVLDDDEEAESPPPQAMAIAPTRAVTERRTRTRFIVSSSRVVRPPATAKHGRNAARA